MSRFQVLTEIKLLSIDTKNGYPQMINDFSQLKRPRYPMPEFVKNVLEERGLMDVYKERPAYQQNDYVGWISRAKRPETRDNRLQQMLDELEKGGVYMKMKHLGFGFGYIVSSNTALPKSSIAVLYPTTSNINVSLAIAPAASVAVTTNQ